MHGTESRGRISAVKAAALCFEDISPRVALAYARPSAGRQYSAENVWGPDPDEAPIHLRERTPGEVCVIRRRQEANSLVAV